MTSSGFNPHLVCEHLWYAWTSWATTADTIYFDFFLFIIDLNDFKTTAPQMMGFAVVRWAVFKTRCHENYPGWSGIPTVDDDNPQYSHRIHAAIYGNMDPINIPPMLAYIPAPWILWDIVEPPTIIWDLAATFLQGALCQRVWKKGTTLKWGMLPEVTRCFSNRFQEKHVTQILSWVFLPSHRSFIKLVEDFQESPSMNGEIARVSSPFKWCWYLHEKYLHEIPINQLIYI